ncbi:MAG: DUF6132 family protein [Elusimicrobiota bacterium]
MHLKDEQEGRQGGIVAEDSMAIGKVVLGLTLGAVAGYLGYRIVGCSTGACPLTSNPYVSTLYGALMGLTISLS